MTGAEVVPLIAALGAGAGGAAQIASAAGQPGQTLRAGGSNPQCPGAQGYSLDLGQPARMPALSSQLQVSAAPALSVPAAPSMSGSNDLVSLLAKLQKGQGV